MANGTLYISRHGESTWNTLGKWTGLTDVDLTKKGVEDAKRLGQAFLAGVNFDQIYVSGLKRTHQTLDALMEGAGSSLRAADKKVVVAPELNERDYGDYTGKNKWEVMSKVTPEDFTGIRRGWNHPIPGGENLQQVYERVQPYFMQEILPKLKAGKNILIVAHGNSIRALMKYLDSVSDEQIADVEMPLGQLLIYTFDGNSDLPIEKQSIAVDIGETKA